MFKKCGMCKYNWKDRFAFLQDTGVSYYDYQVFTENLEEGLFLFEHACGTTLSELVGTFIDMYNGPIYEKNMMGSEQCPGFCLDEKETRICSNKCSCAHIRHILKELVSQEEHGVSLK